MPRAVLPITLLALLGSVEQIAAADSARGNAPVCNGAYAEDFASMSPAAKALESQTPSYSFAIRTSAVYECVSYGSDAQLKRLTTSVRAHGTGFAYRKDGATTLLVTNEHVASWPAVTDDEHQVDGVARGCKRLSETIAIVDDDRDTYTADDIPLERVAVDPALDIAILRAPKALPVIPWKIGKSAALSARDVVEVRGFPLGRFRATNTGKVISTHDHDDSGVRDHDDFVIDALLAPGGSGSPVFAVACATGELELVGVFHSHYVGASALNVVIAIDQVRDLMATLKVQPAHDPALALDATARKRVADAARADGGPAFFALGPLVASVTPRADGALEYVVYPDDFPRDTRPLARLEDLPSADPAQFGTLGKVFLGASKVPFAAKDDTVAHLLELLRRDAVLALDLRDAVAAPTTTKDEFERVTHRRAALERTLDGQHTAIRDLASTLAALPAPTPVVTN